MINYNRTASKSLPMSHAAGTQEAYDRVWPDVSGYSINGLMSDPSGYYHVEYLGQRGPGPSTVTFDGEYWSTILTNGSLQKGRWVGPSDIPKIIQNLQKKQGKARADIEKALGLVGKSHGWSSEDEAAWYLYSYEINGFGKSSPDGEPLLYVKFHDYEEVLFDGRRGRVEFEYRGDSSQNRRMAYGGSDAIGTLKEMSKILDQAVRWGVLHHQKDSY